MSHSKASSQTFIKEYLEVIVEVSKNVDYNQGKGIYFLTYEKSLKEMEENPNEKIKIKIGKTSNIFSRLKTYKQCLPDIELLSFIPLQKKVQLNLIEKFYLQVFEKYYSRNVNNGIPKTGGTEWIKASYSELKRFLPELSSWWDNADMISYQFRKNSRHQNQNDRVELFMELMK